MFNSPRHPGFCSEACTLLFANKGRKPCMPHCFGDKVEENWSTDWLFLYDSGGGVGWGGGRGSPAEGLRPELKVFMAFGHLVIPL